MEHLESAQLLTLYGMFALAFFFLRVPSFH
jgi:hypothetical protein